MCVLLKDTRRINRGVCAIKRYVQGGYMIYNAPNTYVHTYIACTYKMGICRYYMGNRYTVDV